MNDFRRDHEWQLQKRDEFVVPYYARKFAGFLTLDNGPFARLQQDKSGIDTLVWDERRAVYAIEEKLVRYPGYVYDSICLETESCTNPRHIKRGWMWYSKADFLLYGMETEQQSFDCLWMDFGALWQWFWKGDRYKDFKTTVKDDQINKSLCAIVPIKFIEKALGQHRLQRFVLLKPKVTQAAE